MKIIVYSIDLNSFSISSIEGNELLKFSGIIELNSYSDMPIGALIMLTAY